MKTVDVCIPVYKPGEDFNKLMYRISHQDHRPRCIRIINTDVQFWSEEYLREPRRLGIPVFVEHIARDEFDHGATRDEMAAASDADFLLFMTDDAYPRDDKLISSLLEAFENERTGAAYARQIPKSGCSLPERQSRLFNYPPRSEKKTAEDITRLGIKTYFCSNVCAMYRRDIYSELSGFPKGMIFNEDMVFAATLINAGYAIVYKAEALVYHSHNYTIPQYFRRSFDMAVSQADHPDVFEGVSSEKEGMRLVKSVCGKSLKAGRPLMIIPFGFSCVAKYAGYFLGRRYEHLPRKIILMCTSNKSFWKNA